MVKDDGCGALDISRLIATEGGDNRCRVDRPDRIGDVQVVKDQVVVRIGKPNFVDIGAEEGNICI